MVSSSKGRISLSSAGDPVTVTLLLGAFKPVHFELKRPFPAFPFLRTDINRELTVARNWKWRLDVMKCTFTERLYDTTCLEQSLGRTRPFNS